MALSLCAGHAQPQYVPDTTGGGLAGTWLGADSASLSVGSGGNLVVGPSSSSTVYQFHKDGTFSYTAQFSGGISIHEKGTYRTRNDQVTLSPTSKTYRGEAVSRDALQPRSYVWRAEIDTIRNRRSLVVGDGPSMLRFIADAPLPATAHTPPPGGRAPAAPQGPSASVCEITLVNQPYICRLPPGFRSARSATATARPDFASTPSTAQARPRSQLKSLLLVSALAVVGVGAWIVGERPDRRPSSTSPRETAPAHDSERPHAQDESIIGSWRGSDDATPSSGGYVTQYTRYEFRADGRFIYTATIAQKGGLHRRLRRCCNCLRTTAANGPTPPRTSGAQPLLSSCRVASLR